MALFHVVDDVGAAVRELAEQVRGERVGFVSFGDEIVHAGEVGLRVVVQRVDLRFDKLVRGGDDTVGLLGFTLAGNLRVTTTVDPAEQVGPA